MTATLFQLQQLDLELDRLVAEKQAITAALQDSASLRSARAEYEAAQQKLQANLQAQREAEWTLKDLTQRLKTVEARLYNGSVKNDKEMNAVQGEIQRLRTQQDSQEVLVLDHIDTEETLSKDVEQKRRLVAAVDESWQQERAGLQQRLDQLEARMQQLQTRRTGITQGLDGSLLKRYQTLRSTRQGKAISKIEQNSCQWCRVILTPSEIQRVRLSSDVQTCMNCGRILYYER
jgi:predicted  nucleic acid-binding Zn-ribbon protein